MLFISYIILVVFLLITGALDTCSSTTKTVILELFVVSIIATPFWYGIDQMVHELRKIRQLLNKEVTKNDENVNEKKDASS